MTQRRRTRRWFLATSGGMAAAAAFTAAGCDLGGKDPRPTPPGEATLPSLAKPSPGTVATPGREGPQRGETVRYAGLVTSDGEFDPHKTQAGALAGQQALVYSRLLTFANQAENLIVPDLAEAMPEQPDGQTFIFRLKRNARWPEEVVRGGRAVTSEDVKFSIERQLQGDASFVRRGQWAIVDRIDASDPHALTVVLKQPYAPMPALFAGVHSYVLPREAADGGFSRSRQFGSGPFRWVEWNEGRLASVSRNPQYHGEGEQPYLDGVSVSQPRDQAEVEAGLRTKKLDVAFVGRTVADRLLQNIPRLQEQTFGHALFFGMRFFTAVAPYNDLRLRAALTLALDRREMLQRFFDGSGELNAWVSWPVTRWALPQAELQQLSGYRLGPAGREADLKEARALVAAYLSEKELRGQLPLYVPEDTERTLGLGSLLRDQVNKHVDLNVEVLPVSIQDLIGRLLDGKAPWAAGPDTGWVDLDDWLYPYFHSAGAKNSFPLRDAEMDSLIEAQRTELNADRRRDIGFQVQRKLLALYAGVNLVSERVVALQWPYVKGFPLDITDGYQNRFAGTWIDRADPSFRGR